MSSLANNETKNDICRQWLQIAAGLLVFAFGVHLTIFANIGLAPWDCLGMGISYHTPLNYGLSMTAVAILVLVIDLLLKERIGYGTIIDALLTGNFVQMFNDINSMPENDSLWIGIAIMLAGFVFIALGMYIYIKNSCVVKQKANNGCASSRAGVLMKNSNVCIYGRTRGSLQQLRSIDFGTSKKQHRDARKGRNPQTGAEMEIAASDSLSFKSSVKY